MPLPYRGHPPPLTRSPSLWEGGLDGGACFRLMRSLEVPDDADGDGEDGRQDVVTRAAECRKDIRDACAGRLVREEHLARRPADDGRADVHEAQEHVDHRHGQIARRNSDVADDERIDIREADGRLDGAGPDDEAEPDDERIRLGQDEHDIARIEENDEEVE